MSVRDLIQEEAPVHTSSQGERQRMRVYRTRLKRELTERMGLESIADIVANTESERAKLELSAVCSSIVNGNNYGLGEREAERLIAQVIDEICGLGPLQPLLDDDSITEIAVNGCSSLYFEREGELYPAELVFDTPEQIMTVIGRILAPLGRRLDKSNPLVDARLANGDRVNAVAVPTGIDGPYLSIRKFCERISSLDELVRREALPAWYAQLLSWAVRLRQDIAVAGGTGSGKTTLLNALSSEIDSKERIITIEDSAELQFDEAHHVVRLEAQPPSIEGTGEVSIRQLVRNALRMRPDRIVVGEVRGEECIDMLQAMNTGHDGSLTTLHAGNAEEAILRLILMARFGMDLPAELIEEQIATAIDLIVMSEREADGMRLITGLCSVTRSESGSVELTQNVSFDRVTRNWVLEREPAFIEDAIARGQLDESEVQTWRNSIS